MKITALILAFFVMTAVNGQCGNRVFIGTGIGYSAYSEFSFGIEAGFVPALSKLYFTAGGIAYTAKKDLNEKWTTAEAGARVYYFSKVSDMVSIHGFGQIRYITQGGERPGYNQWVPGFGAALTKRISQNQNGEGYLKIEIEQTTSKVSRTRINLYFVGLL